MVSKSCSSWHNRKSLGERRISGGFDEVIGVVGGVKPLKWRWIRSLPSTTVL